MSFQHNLPNGERVPYEGSFRKAIWPFLVVGQFFGVLPVKGVTSSSVSDLQFKWTSFRTIYGLVITAYQLVYFVFLMWKLLHIPIELDLVGTILYYSINALQLACYFGLASKWASLMKHWQSVEQSLSTFCSQRQKTAYIFRLRFIALFFMTIGLIEHLIADISVIHVVVTCHNDQDPFTELAKHNVPHLIDFTERAPFLLALVIDFINLSGTFVWNYSDAMIMALSKGLSTHFKLFNQELQQASFENFSHEFWMKMREEYTKLCDLVAVVDKRISHIIILSYFNNLFFICRQLFESLRPAFETYYRQLYFWFSLILVILRIFCVSMFAANVYDESKKPIMILHSVPSNLWNAETKRFRDEVVNNTVALSGMKFFYLTRTLILSVAGTIATYELVLMQFNKSQEQPAFCN